PSVNKAVNYKAAPGNALRGSLQLPSATGQGVAAAAFDAAHNRLYFTNMRASELLYFDFNSKDLNVVVNNDASFNSGNKYAEGNVITRMTFGSDGLGYALTNDGKSLIRFTTDQKPTVSNLGELIDGKKNGTISVHSQCSSWGGDMVGDAYGNLYLVTYRNHVFKINPTTRIADYLGQVKGLPAEFTSNGMVVDNDGYAIVTSATISDNYYRVNISTLEATAVNKKEDKVFNASDLANGNFLYKSKGGVPENFLSEIKGNQAISIYPNPVANKNFSVQFDKVPVGKYNLVLTDASGRNVLSRALSIGVKGQVERISIPQAASGGMYMVKLTGGDSKVVYNDKLVVQ
ncbi:MAG TPA: T9SS type A sorting domain-containing protein, partial [Segetibacter sp.]